MSSGVFREPLGPDLTVRSEFRPGDIGYLTYLHGVLYAQERGWDYTFECYVAGPLSEFAISNATSPNDRERIWLVEREGTIFGSIGIVQATPDEAQLRWFLVHPILRGRGIGRFLVQEALNFCRSKGYRSVFLWTEKKLLEAAALYRSVGFELIEEADHLVWGLNVTHQRYELHFQKPASE